MLSFIAGVAALALGQNPQVVIQGRASDGTVPWKVTCVSGCSGAGGGGGTGGTVSQGTGYDGGTAWNVTGAVQAQQAGTWNVNATPVGTTTVSGSVSITGTPAVTVSGTAAVSGTVAATQSGTWTVRNQDGVGNALASSTTTPGGTEQALIVRNIPSGTQPISGTVTANAGSGTFSVSGTVAATQSGAWTVRNQDGAGNNLASSTSAPAGTEQALIVRNIPSGTQVISGSVTASGTVAATQSGTWSVRAQDGAGNNLASATTAPGGTEQALIVRPIPSGTQAVSGTVTANAGTGTFAVSAAALPLPTGAATETTLGTRLADSTFTGRINTQGQKTMAASTPVVLASDQASIPVAATISGTPAVTVSSGSVSVTGTVTANAGTGTFTTLETWKRTTALASATSCSTSATQTPASPLANRTTLTLTNNSSSVIYIGGSGVTTATGTPLQPGGTFSDNVGSTAYYCVVATGTADLRALEN